MVGAYYVLRVYTNFALTGCLEHNYEGREVQLCTERMCHTVSIGAARFTLIDDGGICLMEWYADEWRQSNAHVALLGARRTFKVDYGDEQDTSVPFSPRGTWPSVLAKRWSLGRRGRPSRTSKLSRQVLLNTPLTLNAPTRLLIIAVTKRFICVMRFGFGAYYCYILRPAPRMPRGCLLKMGIRTHVSTCGGASGKTLGQEKGERRAVPHSNDFAVA